MNSLSTNLYVVARIAGSTVRWILRCVVVLGFGLLAACAALSPRTPQEAVAERAQARWDALVRGDFKAAYAFLSPGSRAVLSYSDYASPLKPGFWKGAKVQKVECNTAESCRVDVTVEYERQKQRMKTPFGETWIKEDSEWWYLQK